MPRAEIVSVNADIHGKGSRCVREVPMRMSVQVPRSMMGAIPNPHGVVTDHDGLAMYGDFRKVEPRELLGQLANLFVVISRHRKDLHCSESACGTPALSPCSRCRNPLGNRGCHWP